MPMASKSKSKQEEALEFLDDLDSFAAPQSKAKPAKTPPPPAAAGQGKSNEAEVFAFIDEITQKSTEPTRTAASIPRSGTPTIRKSTERVRLGGGPVTSLPSASSSTTSLNRSASNDGSKSKADTSPTPAAATPGPGAWGWGSVWSTASAAIQQAKTVVDEQVKHLPKNDQVRGWGEGVLEYAKQAQLDKLGQDFKRVGLSTLTDILNVVAPPISEHEAIQIWLSHDMQGYDGVETLVYRALTRILEQVQAGDLVVSRGNEVKPKQGSSTGRELNAVDSYESAVKLAQVEVESLVKNNKKESKPSDINSPTIYSNVYIRIQPYFSEYDLPEAVSSADASDELSEKLQFLVYLYDPEHKLVHTSITQAVSAAWVDIWDDYDWVEDLVADSLRLSVEVIGQEYVVSRMGWAKKGEDQGASDAPDAASEEGEKKLGDS
ncbi:maintenance of telomere capping protein 1 [Ephemerocybe angulata]|uniref:Maintenance of telomere capping protein 1 n=1 Tax=Ephemerocybe angulata TaxID=980116 RepID=A0A8H6IL72_9AGAR|nr:maintenance of telomere capping protein 1 [Tulosesus angulatus]